MQPTKLIAQNCALGAGGGDPFGQHNPVPQSVRAHVTDPGELHFAAMELNSQSDTGCKSRLEEGQICWRLFFTTVCGRKACLCTFIGVHSLPISRF